MFNNKSKYTQSTDNKELNYLSPFYQTYPANGFAAISSPERENPPFALPHSIQQQPSFASYSRRSSHESDFSNTTSSRKSSFNTVDGSINSISNSITQHKPSDTNENDKKHQQRERNKQAASRFRTRQQYKTESLQAENNWLKAERERLQRENTGLKDENRRLHVSLEQQGQYEGYNNSDMYTQRIY